MSDWRDTDFGPDPKIGNVEAETWSTLKNFVEFCACTHAWVIIHAKVLPGSVLSVEDWLIHNVQNVLVYPFNKIKYIGCLAQNLTKWLLLLRVGIHSLCKDRELPIQITLKYVYNGLKSNWKSFEAIQLDWLVLTEMVDCYFYLVNPIRISFSF